jgi:large subunit ribosomal protein L29
MKAQEIRDLSDDALFQKATQLRESLFRLRFQLALGHQEYVKQIRQDRKDLARVKTELRAREVRGEIEGGTSIRNIRSRAERRVKTARALRGSVGK